MVPGEIRGVSAALDTGSNGGCEELDGMLLSRLARQALTEDGAWQDVTTAATVDPAQRGTATVLAKRDGVIAGLPVMAAVFAALDPATAFKPLIRDGDSVRKGDRIATVSGSYAAILRAERVALNFLQRLSATATMTAEAVRGAAGAKARIIDTRKTTPGLRYLERYAVRAGGGR